MLLKYNVHCMLLEYNVHRARLPFQSAESKLTMGKRPALKKVPSEVLSSIRELVLEILRDRVYTTLP